MRPIEKPPALPQTFLPSRHSAWQPMVFCRRWSARRWSARLLITPLVLLFVWIGGTAAAQPMAAIRLIHLSPDAPRADLVVDHQLFLRDVTYGQITPYRALPAGQHEISVYPHRLPDSTQPAGEQGPPALEPITILVDLEDGMYYTLAVSGFYQQPSADDLTGSLVAEVDPPDAQLTVSGPRGFSQRFQGGAVVDALVPGEYNIQAQRSGHLPATFAITVRADETATVSISLQEAEGEAADIDPEMNVSGTATGWRPLELHAFLDELNGAPPPGGSRLRVIHMSPTTLPVDLLALPVDGGGEPITLASGLTFPNSGSFVRLPGREFTIQVRLAGSGAVLTETAALNLQPGAVYTLFLVREPEDNYLRLIPSVDLLLSARR